MIGLLGAYGEVGRLAAQRIRARWDGPIRLGGRDPEQLRAVAADVGGVGTSTVDVDDPAALAEFCAGCQVVVNCCAPSVRIGDRIAAAALAAGADHVDAGDGTSGFLDGVRTERTVVYSAGMWPGLSGVLPRYLAAREFDRVMRLQACIGGLDRIGFGGAYDLLAGLRGSRSANAPATAISGPNMAALLFFPRAAKVLYRSPDADEVARALGAESASWFHMIVGSEVYRVLGDAVSAGIADGSGLTSAAQRLTETSALDCAGRRPFWSFVYQLDGQTGGRDISRTLLLTADSTAALTATAVALTTLAVLGGDMPPGVHPADAVLDPEIAVAELAQSQEVTALDVFPTGALSQSVEEGAL